MKNLFYFTRFLTRCCRIQDETARVEDLLIQPISTNALINCFVTAKANSFENMLDPLLKILRISRAVTSAISKPQFFKRLLERLSHKKAVVRLTLLRILKVACDVHPNRSGLVERFGIFEIVEKLSVADGAVLVRELAREIKPSLTPVLKPPATRTSSSETPKAHMISRPKSKRTASETSILFTESPKHRSNNLPLTSTFAAGRRARSRKLSGDLFFDN